MGATLTQPQRVQVRRYMGASRIFTQLWPKLENAMNAIASLADGGTQPDDSAVLLVQQLLGYLADLECKLITLQGQVAIVDAGSDKVKLDTGKALFLLYKEGRRYIGSMSDVLSCHPLRDYYSSPQTQDEPGQSDRAFSDYGA